MYHILPGAPPSSARACGHFCTPNKSHSLPQVPCQLRGSRHGWRRPSSTSMIKLPQLTLFVKLLSRQRIQVRCTPREKLMGHANRGLLADARWWQRQFCLWQICLILCHLPQHTGVCSGDGQRATDRHFRRLWSTRCSGPSCPVMVRWLKVRQHAVGPIGSPFASPFNPFRPVPASCHGISSSWRNGALQHGPQPPPCTM